MIQHQITLPAMARGLHLITTDIIRSVPEIGETRVGLLHLFLQHTSASLTINENADPDVQVDLKAALHHLVPEQFPYTHTSEGSDDMPAHIKCSLLGCSLLIPVSSGHLALGTWQGVFLFEHRNRASARRIVATLWP